MKERDTELSTGGGCCIIWMKSETGPVLNPEDIGQM